MVIGKVTLPWPSPGALKSSKKWPGKKCLQREPTGTQMEPKSAPKSVKSGNNEHLETDSKKHAEKVPKRESPDPPK